MKAMYAGALRGVAIKLSDVDPASVLNDPNSNPIPTRVQLLRTGKFFLPSTNEELTVTPEMLRKMAENFTNKVRGIDIAIDYKHDSEDIAAAWIRRVELDEDRESGDVSLWAEVEWTRKGQKVIGEKEFRYLSADFHPNYRDNESQAAYGPTLLGAGLTNRPVVKRMEPVIQLSESMDSSLYGDPGANRFPIDTAENSKKSREEFKRVALSDYQNEKSRAIVHDRIVKRELDLGIVPSFDENDSLDQLLSPDLKSKLKKGNKEMSEKELKEKISKLETQLSEANAQVKKLSEAQAKLQEMDMTPEEMMAKIKELQAMVDQLKGDNESLKEGKKLSEKNKEFDKLLSEGKACEAQRQAFLDGDTVKFAELAEKVNLREKGGAGSGGAGGDKSAADQVIELSEKKMKENPGMNPFDVTSQVLAENPELEKQYRKEQGE